MMVPTMSVMTISTDDDDDDDDPDDDDDVDDDVDDDLVGHVVASKNIDGLGILQRHCD